MPIAQQIMMAAASPPLPVPSTIANIWEWWEPSRETAYNDNDVLTTLHGQVNGRNWTATGSPLYRTNQINGLAAVRCPSAARYNGPDMSAITAGHVFIIPVVDAETANGLWQIGTGGTPVYPFFGDIYENAMSTARVGNPTGNPTAALTSYVVYEITSITNEWITKVNGTQLGSTITTNTVGLPAAPLLGANQIGGSSDSTLNGYIAGMYLFSAKLGSTDRTSMINYINGRFALSST